MFNLRNRKEFPTLAPLFAGHDDDLLLYLGTNTSSAKVGELERNPKGCVHSSGYPQLVGMMLAGDLEVAADTRLRKALWIEGWERYYPTGVDDPDYTVLRLLPRFVSGWYHSTRIGFRIADR